MEGILCSLYNQYLSKGGYENFIGQLTFILDKKGKTFEIKRGGALRSIVRDFLIQVIIDGKSYILIEDKLILNQVAETLTDKKITPKQLKQAYKSLNWI